MNIITANKSQFHEAFANWHGGKFKDYFSFEGREAIFYRLKELDEEIELEDIEINYEEMTEAEIRHEYDLTEDDDIEEFLEEVTWWKETTQGSYVFCNNF